MFAIEFFSTITKTWKPIPSEVGHIATKAEADSLLAITQAKNPKEKLRIKKYR